MLCAAACGLPEQETASLDDLRRDIAAADADSRRAIAEIMCRGSWRGTFTTHHAVQ
jgi:hypothetical protein